MVPKTIDFLEVTTHATDLLNEVEHGSSFFVARNNQVIAKIIPFKKRVLGLHKGAITCTNDFDDELISILE